MEKRGIFGRLKTIRRVRTYYKPFWYVKGMIFCTLAEKGATEVLAKTWYHTFQANDGFFPFFRSMGVRSEVLTLQPLNGPLPDSAILLSAGLKRADAEREARKAAVLNMNVTTAAAGSVVGKDRERLVMNFGAAAGARPGAFRDVRLVGARYVLLYYPVVEALCEGSVCDWTYYIDGANGGILADMQGAPPSGGDRQTPQEDDAPPELLSHRCKNCGADLRPGDFDVIFYCGNCFRLWLLDGRDYRPMNVRVITPPRPSSRTVFIPFWNMITAVGPGGGPPLLETIGDLARTMKMGRHILRNEDPERPLRFLVPALVARNAAVVMKLAARINVFQKDCPYEPGENFPYARALGASLTEAEARAMLRPLLFAVVGRSDRGTLDLLRNAEITVRESELVWYPFEDRGAALADHFHNFHLPRTALKVKLGRQGL